MKHVRMGRVHFCPVMRQNSGFLRWMMFEARLVRASCGSNYGKTVNLRNGRITVPTNKINSFMCMTFQNILMLICSRQQAALSRHSILTSTSVVKTGYHPEINGTYD